jgi:aspartate/methionine/tyrosine aminotransferase
LACRRCAPGSPGHYRDFYGTEIDPARVVLTTGSSGAFLLSFLAAFDAGDRVALASPGYPAYRNILLSLDLEPVALPTGPEIHYQPTPDPLDKLDGPIDGLIVASPANPTGTMLRGNELKRLYDYCSREFCRRMLVEAEVAATPGAGFDTERGHRHLRFSFAGATADMEEAVRRLAAWRR